MSILLLVTLLWEPHFRLQNQLRNYYWLRDDYSLQLVKFGNSLCIIIEASFTQTLLGAWLSVPTFWANQRCRKY